MKEATWQKGKKTIKGRWKYYRPSDVFVIEIGKRNPITGDRRQIIKVYGSEEPEWNGWRLVR